MHCSLNNSKYFEFQSTWRHEHNKKKIKNKNITLSEQFQNPIEKGNVDVPTHKYMTVHFSGLILALQWKVTEFN
jgi:hypothetical protein